MRRIWFVFLLIGLFAVLHAAAAPRAKVPPIEVNGPTVVAFFPPVSDAELEKDPDLNEVLSDFQFHTDEAAKSLRRRGIVLQQVYARAFSIKLPGGTRLITPHQGPGYYFVEPGKAPFIHYGVMTDDDLVDLAMKRFRLVWK